jgi:hypothetical protein
MKFLVIFSIFFIFVHNFGQSIEGPKSLNEIFNIKQNRCNNFLFANEGEKCDTNPNSRFQCKAFLQCQDGACKRANIGSPCNRHSDCFLNRDTGKINLIF